jgi:hypothetical protein
VGSVAEVPRDTPDAVWDCQVQVFAAPNRQLVTKLLHSAMD